MKKLLIIFTLSILFPSSITMCSQDKASDRRYQVIGILAFAGMLYAVHNLTKSNSSSDNPSFTPNLSSQNQSEQKEEQKPNLEDQLGNSQPSGTEKSSENNDSKIKPKIEKPQVNNNQTILPKLKTENKSSHNETIVPLQGTNTSHINTEEQISFSQAICKGYRENATKKFVIDTLLTEHAFSN